MFEVNQINVLKYSYLPLDLSLAGGTYKIKKIQCKLFSGKTKWISNRFEDASKNTVIYHLHLVHFPKVLREGTLIFLCSA